MARIRHRKSTNPFKFRFEVQRPDWAAIMGGQEKPIEVDLGFGRGEFLLARAQQDPDTLFVGIEIRPHLIEKMNERLQEEEHPNIHLILANVKEHLSALFDAAMLSCVYIHFPDPWTQRKRHHKRRMVDDSLVSILHTLLKPGGEIHLMTDKEPVALEMRMLFETHGGFINACGAGQFCTVSTTGVRTREEQYYLDKGASVYRLKFIRDNTTIIQAV